MNAKELEALLAEIDRLHSKEQSSEYRAELVAIRERIHRLRESLLGEDAVGISDEARHRFGLSNDGTVVDPKCMSDAIKAMAESFKKSRLLHDDKKAEIVKFLKELRPSMKVEDHDPAEKLVHKLETTRRFLIIIKKYLANLNENKQDNEILFKIESETELKDVYWSLVQKAKVQNYTIKTGRMHRDKSTNRFYYDTTSEPLIPDLEARWEEAFTAEGLQGLHQHNEYGGDTVDYLQRESDAYLVFYPGDVRERWAFSHRRTNPTESELLELLEHEGVKLPNWRPIIEKKGKAKEFAKSKKKERCEELLAEMRKIAGPEGTLKETKETRAHHAILNRNLSEKIREARVLTSELLETYHQKYTVTQYIGKVEKLDQEIPDVTQRIVEWQDSYDGILRRITPLWELADARDGMDENEYKFAALAYVQTVLDFCPGGTVWDMTYTKVHGQDDPDGSKYKAEAAEWKDAYLDDLVATFGKDEALKMPRNLPLLEVVCMFTFKQALPSTFPVSVFMALWRQGYFDWDADGEEWAGYLVPDLDWDAFVTKLDVELVKDLHDFAISVWQTELLQLNDCIEWAKGNIEERRTAKWAQHGQEIAQYIAEANGVIAFVNTYKGCYDKIEKFIGWVLEPQHELGRSRMYEGLVVGSGVINFQVSLSLEASLFSRISASVTLSYQYSGKLSQDDDRRVRWTGTHSFNLGIAADAKLTLKDIAETQVALDLINASVAADKELYSTVHVSVYESPRHVAAVWAQGIARARSAVMGRINGINTPGGFVSFKGIPETETQDEVLKHVVDDDGKLAKILDLLKRTRTKAARSGWKDYESDWKLVAEASVPLLKGRLERLAHSKTVMHFTRKVMSEEGFPKEKYGPNVVTNTWGKSLLHFPISPLIIDTADLGISVTREIAESSNPLDLYPEETTDPPTEELFGAAFEMDNGMFDVGFTHIADHTVPDNDGMYMSIKSYRNWGVGVRHKDFTFSFQGTQRWMKLDPVKLRWQFNYMVECCRFHFQERQRVGRTLPTLEPGDAIKSRLGVLILDDNDTSSAESALFYSTPGKSMMRHLRAMSLFGAYELGFIYTDRGFDVMYGRVWVTRGLAVGFKASLPPAPFIKIGAEISAEMTHCCFESVGLHTFAYILSVFNGVRKRLGADEGEKEWKTWRSQHREEFHALFNQLVDDDSNLHVEVSKDTDSDDDDIKNEATALLALCDITIKKHIDPVRPSKRDVTKRQITVPRNTTSIESTASSSRRNRSKPQTSHTVVQDVDFGVRRVNLFCLTSWRKSHAFRRKGRSTFPDVRVPKNADPVSKNTNPIFVIAPANVYDIEIELRRPKTIKSLKIEIFNDKGATVGSPWTVTSKDIKELFDEKKPKAKVKKTSMTRAIRWYGSKDGKLENATIGQLQHRALQGCGALDPGVYCLCVSVDETTIDAASARYAWTYFTVLDDPFAQLDKYLLALGKKQDTDQGPKWTREEDSENDTGSGGSSQPSSPPETDEESSDSGPGKNALPGKNDSGKPPTDIVKSVKKPAPATGHRVRISRTPKNPYGIMGIRNLGTTCYLNSALQVAIHLSHLSFTKTSGVAAPDLAKLVRDFVAAYKTVRDTSGRRAMRISELNKLKQIRQYLLDNRVITRLDREEDASAALMAILGSYDTLARRASMFHFDVELLTQFDLGVGFAYDSEEGKAWYIAASVKSKVADYENRERREASSRRKADYKARATKRWDEWTSPERVAWFGDTYISVDEDGKATRDDLMNQILISGLKQQDSAIDFATLVEQEWNFDVSGDDASVKIQDGWCYTEAQPQTQVVRISGTLPQAFIVTLKRFRFGDEGADKITTEVTMPTVLNKDVINELGDVSYKLDGIIRHIGSDIATGHYVAYVRRKEHWYCCNDSSITLASSRDIQTARDNGYVYLYRRVVRIRRKRRDNRE